VSRRRSIGGVAVNILGSFVSRNNDVGGYWAIGKLYDHARQHHRQSVNIDLTTKEIQPGGSEFGPMLDKYSSLLSKHLADIGIAPNSLMAAKFQLTFDAAVTDARPPSSMPGLPFRCTFELVDQSEHVHSASHVGIARPHDPARETRSRRA
jgi:hypothetical protein